MINLIKDILKSKLNYQIGQKTWFGTGGKASLFLTLNSIEFILGLLITVTIFLEDSILSHGSKIELDLYSAQ